MKFKKSAFIFLFTILFFAVAAQPRQQSSAIVSVYNEWLKATKLNFLISAAHITDTIINPLATTSSPTLLLTPTPEYSDPQKFASAWNYLKKGFKDHHIELNTILLNKLANYYSSSEKQALKISVRTADPRWFNLNIGYNENMQIIADEAFLVSREGSNSFTFDWNAVAANVGESCITIGPQASTDVIKQKLVLFFKKYKHVKNDVNIEVFISRDKKKLSLSIYNIYGQITGKNLNEVLYLDMDIDRTNLCYTIDALYAPGIMGAPDPVSEKRFYHEILLEFPQQWSDYKDNLYKTLSALFQ